MLTITERDFQRLTQFIQTKYGINLTKKKSLLVSRLSNTLTSMGYKDFTSYVNYITTTANQNDIEVMLNKLTTNYTFFMRENTHFDFLKNKALPELVAHKKDRTIQVWSAGCASGEEPYTIAMVMKDFFRMGHPGWNFKILATDISQNALQSAQNATYNEESLASVPPKWKQEYFSIARTTPASVVMASTKLYSVAPAIKSLITFKTFNLMKPIVFGLKFDIIFCRNVMIYFDQPTKDALINRFYQVTNPGGYLLIGHSETVARDKTSYKYIMPAVYQK